MTAIPGTAGRLAELYALAPQPLYGPEGAVVYDAVSRHDPAEIGDVLRLAQGIGGPVLELACGSGRVTLPLIARGHTVVALDNSKPLLAMLAETGCGARLIEDDMTLFDLGESFALVVLATSSVCLLDADQRAETFRRVHDHLDPGGIFYVSVLDFGDVLRHKARPVERTTIAAGDRSVTTLFQYFDGRRRVRTTALLHESVVEGVTTDRAIYASEVNIVSAEQLAGELTAAGLDVVHQRRGPDGEQVLVQLICRRP